MLISDWTSGSSQHSWNFLLIFFIAKVTSSCIFIFVYPRVFRLRWCGKEPAKRNKWPHQAANVSTRLWEPMDTQSQKLKMQWDTHFRPLSIFPESAQTTRKPIHSGVLLLGGLEIEWRHSEEKKKKTESSFDIHTSIKHFVVQFVVCMINYRSHALNVTTLEDSTAAVKVSIMVKLEPHSRTIQDFRVQS